MAEETVVHGRGFERVVMAERVAMAEETMEHGEEAPLAYD